MAKTLCGTNYPTSICFIVVNEFCERFSYYGMKAVLVLYFLSYMHWDQDRSTAVYHAFSSLCYFTPVLGAIIADSWLGKYRTIVSLSVVYVVGHVVKSVGAVPVVGTANVHIALSMAGLVLIAVGTGGIKPCVAAFGGDQFDEEHGSERQKFFSIFYMAINAGSLLSTVVTPILRGDVQCFGGDCYALAFGVPAALMVVALVVFIAGSGQYKRTPPRGNVLLEVCGCVGFAIKNRWRSQSDSRRTHWLDWAEEKYSKCLIQEVKMVLRVLVLYVPLPMFWALFDQQGSRWTLQATRMNTALGDSFIVKPDQMQMLNALLILVFVPVFELIVYPLVGFCRIRVTPLRKMATGMVFAALAFGAAALVELNVVSTVVAPPPVGACLLQVLNLAHGDVSLKLPGANAFQPIRYLQDPPAYETVPASGEEMKIQVSFNGNISECNFTPDQQGAYTLLLSSNSTGVHCSQATDHVTKNADGNPLLRFLNTLPEPVTLAVGAVTFQVTSGLSMSPNQTVERGRYQDVSCCLPADRCSLLDLGLLDFGASYTVVLVEEAGVLVARRLQDVAPNDVSVAWQVPQYVLLTMGEVMFSVTGLEFSYSQAPPSMKSALQAGWLLTVAFGNVIVLIVAEGAGLEQWKEFLLFAGLLLLVFVIFSVMAYFYTYVDLNQPDRKYRQDSGWEEDEEDEEDEKKNKDEVQLDRKSTRL